jgi:hypothetical protein
LTKYTLTFAKGAYPPTQAEKDHALAVYAKFLRGVIDASTVVWNDSKRSLAVNIDDSKLTLLQVSALNSINAHPEQYPCFQKLEHGDEC